MIVMQKILRTIYIIMIFIILISLYFCKRGRIFLDITNENTDQVNEYLNDYIWSNDKKYYSYYYISNNKQIKKLAYGRDWTKECIYVYYSSTDIKPDKLIIYEGETKKGKLAEYIKQNGYNENAIWKWIIAFAVISITFCIIKLLIINK